jgi:hypothetical protein
LPITKLEAKEIALGYLKTEEVRTDHELVLLDEDIPRSDFLPNAILANVFTSGLISSTSSIKNGVFPISVTSFIRSLARWDAEKLTEALIQSPSLQLDGDVSVSVLGPIRGIAAITEKNSYS